MKRKYGEFVVALFNGNDIESKEVHRERFGAHATKDRTLITAAFEEAERIAESHKAEFYELFMRLRDRYEE